jgi:predicted TIM-barrel fold metal-dependent hydrolase
VRFVRDDEARYSLSDTGGAGLDMWFSGDKPIAPAAISGGGRWREPLPSHPPTLADVVPGAMDAKARLADMDAMGIAVQVVYPNVAGLGSQQFREMPLELALECTRAYNNFLLEWTGPDPQRFVPVAATPYWDVEAAVAEIRRVAALGYRSMLFPGSPQDWEQPVLASEHWNPIWGTAQECGLVVSFHAGSGNFTARMSAAHLEVEGFHAAWSRATTQILFDTAGQVADLLMSGVLPRFPTLRFVIVEGGLGWVPFLLESLDFTFKSLRVNQHRAEFEGVPSDYFRRQVKVCYWFEQPSTELFERVGVGNVLFETDYPHPACLTEEQVRVAVDERLALVSDEDRKRVLHGNAAELYGLEPSVVEGVLQ